MRFSGLRAAIAAAVTLAGVALTVPAASAATAGDHGHGLQPQVFTLVISTKTPDGVVNAYGPIRGRDGTDVQVSDNVDIFKFARGTVTVYHKPTTNNQPKVDTKSCTATYTEKGTWKLTDGTGKYKGAAGHGRYSLSQFAVLQHKDHKCDTSSEPKFFKVKIFAWGKAAIIGHQH
jgi:hypothetical protein